MSTANLFELPLYYQYGISSAGFVACRARLEAKQKATADIILFLEYIP